MQNPEIHDLATINAIGALLITKNGNIILQKRDEGAPTEPNKICTLGGHVDPNEHPKDCVRRELIEEIDLDIEKYNLTPLYCGKLPSASQPDKINLMTVITGVPDIDYRLTEGEYLVKVQSLSELKTTELCPTLAAINDEDIKAAISANIPLVTIFK